MFADLSLSNPKDLLFKAELTRRISAAIRAKGLTQIEAGRLLGIDQSKVSALINGHLGGFSTDRLLRAVALTRG